MRRRFATPPRAIPLVGFAVLLAPIALGGCSSESQSSAPASSTSVPTSAPPSSEAPVETALVSGRLALDDDQSFSYYDNRPVELGDDSQATVSIRRAEANMADVPSELVEEITFSVDVLPVEYRIDGEIELDPAYDYFLSATVSLVGEYESRVGDLTSEVIIVLPRSGAVVDIPLTGLEHCDDDSAGGFCSTQVYP